MVATCLEPNCGALVSKGRCVPHQSKINTAYSQRRPDDSFYRSPEWRKLRRQVLDEEPYCCCGCGAPSTTVDHIIAVRGNPSLSLERFNLRAMSTACHSRRSAQDGQRWGKR